MNYSGQKPDAGSFRDRRARVWRTPDGVYRLLDSRALADWHRLEASELYRESRTNGRIVATESIGLNFDPQIDPQGWAGAVRHELLDLITYPYEWTFTMLKDAALLQLDLHLAAMREGMSLRDATPYNIQWKGVDPIFIDTPSFGELDPGSPWQGYRQFCQLFLNPLMMQAYLNIPFQTWLRGHLDGIEPETFRNFFRWSDAFKSGVLTHVFLQSSMEMREKTTSNALQEEMKRAGLQAELVKSVLTKMRKLVAGLTWKARQSRWSSYTDQRGYQDLDLRMKEEFVQRACSRGPIRTVWDVGCNDGRFSRIAAQTATRVLALDSDTLVIDRLYTQLKTEQIKNIYPLVFNFTDPSPGLGWRNLERPPLEERSTPDLLLCLAVFHHLVISANVPLPDLIEHLANQRARLVAEFVTRQDPMVQALLGAKDDPFEDYDLANFEKLAERHFEIVERQELPSGTRVLFELLPR